MNEEYKDILIDNIIDDYESGNYSLYEIAKKNNFPSLKILKNVLKNYYRKELKIEFNFNEYFSDNEKYDIYNLYKFHSFSLQQLATKYMTTIRVIKNTIEEFETIESIRSSKTGKKSIDELNIDFEEILDQLKQGKTYSYITQKYGIPYEKLKKKLAQSPQGKEIIENKRIKRSSDIPIRELVTSLKNHDLDNLEKKYGVSETTIRNKLKKEFGDNYIDILVNGKNNELINNCARLYEQGLSYKQIAQKEGITVDDARNNVIKYYRRKKLSRPRVLSETQANKFLSYNKNFDEVIEECKKQNIIIPKSLMDKYVNMTGETDIHKIKTMAHEQLSKLKQEGREPNYINPFILANSIKKNGYGTNYQACAILYSLIIENNLPLDILKEIENQEIVEAVIILLNKDNINKAEFLTTINKNKLAYIVYKEENNLQLDQKAIDENR